MRYCSASLCSHTQKNPIQDPYNHRQQSRIITRKASPTQIEAEHPLTNPILSIPHPHEKKATLCRSSGLPIRYAAMQTAYATINTKLTWMPALSSPCKVNR